MIVQKYGGSSVATLPKLRKIAAKIKNDVLGGEKVIVVVSARGKTTNKLIAETRKLTHTPDKRALDMMLVTGEMQTVSLLTIELLDKGVKAVGLTGEQCGISTVGNHQKSFIKNIDKARLSAELSENDVVVVAGFQGKNEKGDFTTLGRGGSDTTAVALAAALSCPCDIYTDVDGVYNGDPRILFGAKKLNEISYDEMMQMAVCGAKVLDARSVELAKKYAVKLYLGKSLEKQKRGTNVTDKKYFEELGITSIALLDGLELAKISSKNDLPKLFQAAARTGIPTNMFQVVGDTVFVAGSGDNVDDLEKELENTDCILARQGGYAQISLIGLGLATRANVAKRLVETVTEHGGKIYSLTATEISISFLTNSDKAKAITNALAYEFELQDKPQ